jgi:hypothetical protein
LITGNHRAFSPLREAQPVDLGGDSFYSLTQYFLHYNKISKEHP